MFAAFLSARRCSAVMGVALALLGSTLASGTALAADPPFTARFTETTTFRTCPAGAPTGAMCFTGVGRGLTIPPGDRDSTELFAGYVVFDPTTGCGPDANAVRIVTDAGTLNLTTQGVACATGPASSEESGTWTAHGGTGIFDRASGSGPVATTGTFNPDGTVSSQTTYGGSLKLR